jgi:DNA-3-methylpurine glycosylase
MIWLTGYLYDIISSVNRRLRDLKMAKKVKDYYNLAYARDLSRRLQEASAAFDGQKFVARKRFGRVGVQSASRTFG